MQNKTAELSIVSVLISSILHCNQELASSNQSITKPLETSLFALFMFIHQYFCACSGRKLKVIAKDFSSDV